MTLNEITIREIQQTDLNLLFNWRNAPYIVARGAKNKEVTLIEHTNWFNNVLLTNKFFAFIVQVNSTPVGQIRYERSKKDRHLLISIFILEPYQKSGAGSTAISLSLEYIKKNLKHSFIVIAEVLKSNIQSILFFKKNGFDYNENLDDGLSLLKLQRKVDYTNDRA